MADYRRARKQREAWLRKCPKCEAGPETYCVYVSRGVRGKIEPGTPMRLKFHTERFKDPQRSS